MQSNAPYSRHRYRLEQARPEPGDAIVIALAAQVILCIVILLLAVLAKKTDETRYRETKEQYNILVTDPSQGEKAIAWLQDSEGGVQALFGAMERTIRSALSGFMGGETAAQPEVEEIEPSALPSDLAAEESSTAPEQSKAEQAFAYNYLDTDQISYDSPLGQGGLNPVIASANTSLTAPPDASLAPVMLSSKLLPPITGLITSEFAYRYHPISGESDFHNGMDIAAEEGRDVLAALPGTVLDAGWSDIYGNYILLQHSDTLRTYYAHCSELLAEKGTSVRQGERIAKVGKTGVATGPHLHFSVLVEDRYTDPYWVLRDNITLVD